MSVNLGHFSSPTPRPPLGPYFIQNRCLALRHPASLTSPLLAPRSDSLCPRPIPWSPFFKQVRQVSPWRSWRLRPWLLQAGGFKCSDSPERMPSHPQGKCILPGPGAERSHLALLFPILLTTFHGPCKSRRRLVLIVSFLPLELRSKKTGSLRHPEECRLVDILGTPSASGPPSAHHIA